MRKLAHIQKTILFIIFSFFYLNVSAQNPIVKVDLNMSGRTEAECNDPNYTPWIPDNAASISKTVNGITFTFKKTGNNGSALKATYYKAGIQAPYYARLGCDGMVVDGGNAGAQIELTISGLSTGTHSLMTYHNVIDNPASNTFAPIDVYVNGALTISNLIMSERALTTDALQSSYLTFNATAGQSVVISYRAKTNSSASIKNVYINGFELNTPNVKNQSKNPIPSDGDLHIDGDNGSATLKWTAGNGATKHRIYFGTDKNCVTTGTASSSCYKGEQTSTNYNVYGLYSYYTYYWRVDEITSGGIVTKGNIWVFRPRQLAFPGAEGYGRFAIGGRGGKVVHVTNLNDSGAGSLRDAVENQSGPRTIVFDVAGIIALNTRLVLSDPFVTVAGQTAPGKGICLRKAPFGFTGNDVIGRYLRLRLGAGPTYDGMGLTGANNSILDHCSISWTIDEAFSSRGGKNITLQKTLISEALNAAGHQNYPPGTEHGYAATIGGDVGSFHHNLLAHNYGRNWSLGGGLDGNAYYAGRLDITNNVVYNWGSRATDGGAMEVNFVNNYYKPGAGTTIYYALSMQHENTGLGTQRAYFAGNVMPGKFNESNQTEGRRETFSNGDSKKYECFVSSPFFPSYVTTQSAENAYKIVLSDVGANQPFFDKHDTRIINETKNGTYTYKGSVTGKPGFPDKESDVGGYENYPTESRPSNWDTDQDGLPDFWEKMIGTNPNSASGDFSDSNADSDHNGYTNLEDYLNWMAEIHYFVASGASKTMNLADLFRGFTLNPTYKVTNVVNGIVSILGNTATFQSSNCGFSSFDLTVTDGTGSSMTRKVGVFVESPTPGNCTLKMYDCNGDVDGTASLDNCGICSGGNTGVTACSGSIQGEEFCSAVGVQEAKNTGFISSGYVNFDNAIGSKGTWNIYAQADGSASIAVRYANGGTTARSMAVSVNGNSQTNLNAPPTGSWTTWNAEYITLNLKAGPNIIQFTSTSADGGPNIDLLAFSDSRLSKGSCATDCNGVFGGTAFIDTCGTCVAGNTGKVACTRDCEGNWGGTAHLDNCGTCIGNKNGFDECSNSMEAEVACAVDGIMLESKNEGFSGSGYVNADNEQGAAISWALNSTQNQTATISFRYANGGDTARDGQLFINGSPAGNVLLPPTGSWTNWKVATIKLNVNSGANELTLSAITTNGLPNIDLLSFSEGVSGGTCLITSVLKNKTSKLNIYPNPTQDKVYWDSEQSWILMNAQGKERAKGNGSEADLSFYPIGLYILKVNNSMFEIIKN